MVETIINWLRTYEFIAIWLEGIALVAIFVWDRLDSRKQHEETLAQMEIMRGQARATETAANAATKSAEVLINSERAWIIAELIPQAVRTSDNHWCRLVGSGLVSMSTEEVLAGHHLRYKLKLTNMGRTPAQFSVSRFVIAVSKRVSGSCRTTLEEPKQVPALLSICLGAMGRPSKLENLLSMSVSICERMRMPSNGW